MPGVSPRNLLAVVLRKTATAVAALRSHASVLYVVLAYPRVTVGRGVIIHPRARLRAYDGGTMVIGAGTSIGCGALLIAEGGTLEIGARGFVGEASIIVAKAGIHVGVDSLIAERVTIRDQDHTIRAFPRRRAPSHAVPIIIGDNVWIGANASVLKGVAIGDDCVVGAHAVVTRDVPAGSIALGVPAVVRGHIDQRSDVSVGVTTYVARDGAA